MERDNNTPLAGSTRTVAKFLFFPKTLGKKTKWLQTTNILQRCVPFRNGAHITLKWVDVSFKD